MGTLWYHLTTFIKYPYCISGDYINSSSSSVKPFSSISLKVVELPVVNKRCDAPHLNRYEIPHPERVSIRNLNKK